MYLIHWVRPSRSEFGWDEHLATASKYLRTKIIDGNV